MVSFPYTKLCTANLGVDQGAAYIVCSVEAARAAGVPEDRWVFPLAGADAHDHWFISHRPELHRSPAIRLAAAAAFALAGVGPDDLGPIDPLFVLSRGGADGGPGDRPFPSMTPSGPLTFDRRPHLRRRARQQTTPHTASPKLVGAFARPARGRWGLATGLGWYATKHSIGVYGSRPPAHQGHDEFGPGATCSPKWTYSRSAPWIRPPSARCGWRPTP